MKLAKEFKPEKYEEFNQKYSNQSSHIVITNDVIRDLKIIIRALNFEFHPDRKKVENATELQSELNIINDLIVNHGNDFLYQKINLTGKTKVERDIYFEQLDRNIVSFRMGNNGYQNVLQDIFDYINSKHFKKDNLVKINNSIKAMLANSPDNEKQFSLEFTQMMVNQFVRNYNENFQHIENLSKLFNSNVENKNKITIDYDFLIKTIVRGIGDKDSSIIKNFNKNATSFEILFSDKKSPSEEEKFLNDEVFQRLDNYKSVDSNVVYQMFKLLLNIQKFDTMDQKNHLVESIILNPEFSFSDYQKINLLAKYLQGSAIINKVEHQLIKSFISQQANNNQLEYTTRNKFCDLYRQHIHKDLDREKFDDMIGDIYDKQIIASLVKESPKNLEFLTHDKISSQQFLSKLQNLNASESRTYKELLSDEKFKHNTGQDREDSYYKQFVKEVQNSFYDKKMLKKSFDKQILSAFETPFQFSLLPIIKDKMNNDDLFNESVVRVIATHNKEKFFNTDKIKKFVTSNSKIMDKIYDLDPTHRETILFDILDELDGNELSKKLDLLEDQKDFLDLENKVSGKNSITSAVFYGLNSLLQSPSVPALFAAFEDKNINKIDKILSKIPNDSTLILGNMAFANYVLFKTHYHSYYKDVGDKTLELLEKHGFQKCLELPTINAKMNVANYSKFESLLSSAINEMDELSEIKDRITWEDKLKNVIQHNIDKWKHKSEKSISTPNVEEKELQKEPVSQNLKMK